MADLTLQLVDKQIHLHAGENTGEARAAAQAARAARDEILTDPGVIAIGADLTGPNNIGTVAARDADIGEVVDKMADIQAAPSAATAAGTARDEAVSAVATVGTNIGNQNVRGAFSGFAPAVHTRRSVLRYDVHAKALVAPGLMTDMQKASARVIDFIGHSDPAGSGVQSAGAGRKPSSGIAGSDPRHMEYLLQQGFDPAYRVINRCVSARASPAMAALVGAVPILVTLASGTSLAASGPAALSLVTPGTHGPSQARGNSYDVYEGYIGTQRCRLINTGTGAGTGAVPIYTLEQVGGVAPITVAPLTQFVLAPDPLDWAQQILFATRNDPTLAQSYFNVDAMMTGRRPGAPLPFLYGTWNWADGTEDTGSAGLTRVLTENARMQDKYGRRFFDWRACFRGDAPYDGSYFPSIWQFSGIDKNQPQNDYASTGDWITNGRLPKFWMNAGKGGADYNHTNEDTKYWRSRYWIEFFGKPLGALGYAA